MQEQGLQEGRRSYCARLGLQEGRRDYCSVRQERKARHGLVSLSLSLSCWSVARSLLIAARRLKRPRQLPHARETSRAMRRTSRTSGCRWPCGASPPRPPRSSPDSPPPPASAIDSSIALRSCVSSSSSSSPPYSPPPPLPPRLLHFELRVPRHHHHLEAVEIHHGQDRADGGALDIRCADVLAARACGAAGPAD